MIIKTTTKFLASALMVLALSIISCTKDSVTGDIGPIGPRGEQGIQGEKGDKGEPGVDGVAQGVPGEKGNQGEPGPEGPKGDTGETGPAGANGADGTNGADGQDGNANVIVSDWFEPKESSFSVNNPAYKALPLATHIKSKIKDGIILVYYDNDIQVQLLPRYTYDHLDGDILKSVDSHINHASNTLYITIRKYGSDLTSREYLWNSSGAAYSKGVRFRYVIVPDGTSAKNSSIDFKKMSYKEVMNHFGLSN